MSRVSVAIIGDFKEQKHTHVALNDAVKHAALHLPFELFTQWISTADIDTRIIAKNFQALWIAPGSPYTNDQAVYNLIQWARENDFPILGTCGGFQYMVVEYAKNVIGIAHADHEESTPDAADLVIAKLSCSLKGQQEQVMVLDRSTWLYQVLGKEEFTGFFNCNYGVNPAYQKQIDQYPFVFTAFSTNGEVRALELKGHRFFKGTLFQPPLESTEVVPNLLLMDFFKQIS